MSDFTLSFTHPWLLLLLIPAAAILVFAMLRIPRKYRNTRNRVVAVVLEAIVLLCAILVLAGFSFSYALGNPENEVILLVDVTDSMEDSAQSRDDYILELIDIGEREGCTMGIVTFGYTQVYAAPLTTKVDTIYDQYKDAQLPDTTATNLSAALEYSAKLFNSSENSKIVVISDGKETDESALASITYVTARGTIIESVYIPSKYESDDVQILSVGMPEGKVTKGEPFDMTLNIQSNYDTSVRLFVTDNGEELTDIEYINYDYDADNGIAISSGKTSITLRCTLDTKELHSICISVGGDAEEYISENNEYHLYFYIDNYNKILIFESQKDQGEDLAKVLTTYGTADSDGDEAYDITILTLTEGTDDPLPLSVNELRQYDLVVLDNVSNSDMFVSYFWYLDCQGLLGENGEYYQYFYTSAGEVRSSGDGGLLPRILDEYVYTYGGGLLTSGGTDEEGNSNAYNKADTYGSVLEGMLPVRTLNYVPPTGVMFIIDTSGSVSGSVDSAILGVKNSLSLLGTGGYVGIMDFSSKGNEILPLTPLTEAYKVDEALERLRSNIQGEGTVLSSSLNTAIANLTAGYDSGLYERMHIIIVTDGNIDDYEFCKYYAQSCKDVGITMSCVIFGEYGARYLSQMVELCGLADGDDNVNYDSEKIDNCRHIYNCSGSEGNIGNCIYDDVNKLASKEINYQETMIGIESSYRLSTLVDGLQYYEITVEDDYEIIDTDLTHLYAYVERYYGTTVKSGASLILTGDYSVPLYAQWSYGKGTVGSYMGDLYYGGGKTIIDEDYGSGIAFVVRVVNTLLAAEDIRPTGIEATLTEDNYTDRITVYADIGEGCSIVGEVYDEKGNMVLNLNEETPKEDMAEEKEFYVTTALCEDNGYSRVDFVIKVPGIYTIELTAMDADGKILRNSDGTEMKTTLYKTMTYSAEYENFDAADGIDLMNSISTGAGYAVVDADELDIVFDGFVTKVIRSVDPTLALIIIALVLFLLAIAVRKFKWKWPHELVRERRQKKLAGGVRQ